MGDPIFFTSIGSQGVSEYVFNILTMWPFFLKVIQGHWMSCTLTVKGERPYTCYFFLPMTDFDHLNCAEHSNAYIWIAYGDA